MTQSQIELGFSNFGHRAKDTGVKSRVSKMSELAKLSVSSSSLTEEKDIALPFSVKFFYSNVFGGGRNWLIPVSLFVLGLLVSAFTIASEVNFNADNDVAERYYLPNILVPLFCLHPILAAGYYYGYYLARNRVLLRSLILGELWLINPEESIAMNNRIVLIMILPIACALVAVVGALLFIALSEYDVPDYYQASLVLEIFINVWGLFVYTFIASQYVWICWIHWKIGKNLVARVVTTDALLAGTSRAPLFHQMKAARESSYDFTSFTTITTPFLGILNLVWIEGFASALAYGRLDPVNILSGVYNFLWAVHFFLVFWSLALAPGLSNDSLIESVDFATAKIMTADYAEAGCQKSEFAFMPSENEELSKNDTSDSSRASKASVIEESRVVPGVSVPLRDEEKKVVGEISSLLRHLDVSRQHYGLTFLGNDITKQQAIALGSTLIGVGAFFFNSALRNA